jgi:hypothetical protein
MLESVPPIFDTDFLCWFRERTELAWASYRTRDFAAAGVGGHDWQRGTRWLDGLTDAEIDGVERRWAIRFPPDYRLFLRELHTVDRPMVGAEFRGHGHLVPSERPSFPNWQTDTAALQERFDWPLSGLLFNVEHDDLWLPSWGERPAHRPEREARIREAARSAARLLPVFGHRYLLAEPCQAGSPVLSVYQTDVIVYGADLRRYLLAEFARLLGVARPPVQDEAASVAVDLTAIPFWSEVWGADGAQPWASR